MTLIGFRSSNHPQQTARRGPDEATDDRATHPDVFRTIDGRFHFTVDVAASIDNAKCARFYTLADNGLEQPWTGERVWCNPPYSDIAPWVRRAWAEWAAPNPPGCIVMLLPANRTEQAWWQDLVEPYRDRENSPLHVEFIRDRLRFIRAGAKVIGPNERPPFGCCLLIWTENLPPRDFGRFLEVAP